MHLYGQPAPGRLRDFGGLDAQEARDGGAGEVDVEDADAVAGQAERERQLRRYGGFADAAFAGEDLRGEGVSGLGREKRRGWAFLDLDGGRGGGVPGRCAVCFRGTWWVRVVIVVLWGGGGGVVERHFGGVEWEVEMWMGG